MRPVFKPAALVFGALICISLCTGCGAKQGYRTMDMEEAVEAMAQEPDCLVVDVRTQEEYEKGHIPGSILLPVDDIRAGKVERLSDKEQLILIYCYTGRRAEDAAALLADMGYTNVCAFGGIVDWKGEVAVGPED